MGRRRRPGLAALTAANLEVRAGSGRNGLQDNVPKHCLPNKQDSLSDQSDLNVAPGPVLMSPHRSQVSANAARAGNYWAGSSTSASPFCCFNADGTGPLSAASRCGASRSAAPLKAQFQHSCNIFCIILNRVEFSPKFLVHRCLFSRCCFLLLPLLFAAVDFLVRN